MTNPVPTLVRYALSLAVPLHAAELVKVPLADLVRQSPVMGRYIIEHGARLLSGMHPTEITEMLTTIAKGLAIRSFEPGGVDFMDLHFEYFHPDLEATCPGIN
jgi:hypothetical protein